MRKCDRHKTYKGIRKPKNGCADCARLYRAVRASIRRTPEDGAFARCRYASITTPGARMDTARLLAELSTCMLHGPQKRYFWMEKQTAASRHFDEMVNKLAGWRKRDGTIFSLFDNFMFHLYLQFIENKAAEKVKYRQVDVEPEEIEEADCDYRADGLTSDEARRRLKGLSGLDEGDQYAQEQDCQSD